MNKTEFLKKLAAHLHILQEDEVKDILDEYEQHIDMKMAQGLSEKDAINDFGKVEELAAEILSAYHVRPDFKSKTKSEKKVFEKVQDNSKKAMDSAGNAVKAAGTKTGSFMKRIWQRIKNIINAPFLYVNDLKEKRRLKKEQNTEVDTKESSEIVTKKGRVRNMGHAIISFCKKCIKWMIRFIYACIFATVGFFELGLLLATGMLLVLLVLGYPVMGVTIAVLGAAMSGLVITFYAGKKMTGR